MIAAIRLWFIRRRRTKLLRTTIELAKTQLADLDSRPASGKSVVSRAYLANAIETAEKTLAILEAM